MDIVEELRQNRESGAKRLVSEYRAGLMSLARRFCQNESDAEELVNATFAKVVHNIDDYLEQSAFFAWMCQILTNLFRESVRRKSHQMEVYPGEVPDIAAADAQEAIYASLDASFLRDAIETLPQDLRRTIVMHYFMDMPVGEIAKVLSISPGTVKWRLHHARIAIAAKLGVAVKKPGGKAVLLALLLCGLTALGAAVWNLIAPGEATGPADSGKSQVASRLSSFAATEASGQATSDIRQSEAFDFRLSTFDLQPSNLSTFQPFNFSTDNSQGETMDLSITTRTTAALASALAIQAANPVAASGRTVYDAGKALRQNCESGAYANPNGVWSYYCASSLSPFAGAALDSHAPKDDGKLDGLRLTSVSYPKIMVNMTDGPMESTDLGSVGNLIEADELIVHPGDSGNDYAVLRFTVPEDGWYSAFASFHDINCQEPQNQTPYSGVDVHVTLGSESAGDTDLVSAIVTLEDNGAAARTQRFDYQMPVRYLTQGTRIQFVVGPNSVYYNDGTGVKAIVVKEDAGRFYDSGDAFMSNVSADFTNPYGTALHGTWFALIASLPNRANAIDFPTWIPANYEYSLNNGLTAQRTDDIKGFNTSGGNEPCVTVNTSDSPVDGISPRELYIHPPSHDNNQCVVARFRPPESGRYSASVVVRDISFGTADFDGIEVFLVVADQIVTNAVVRGEEHVKSTAHLTFDDLLLALGEPVDILISPRSTYYSDGTAVSAIFRREDGEVYDANKSLYAHHASDSHTLPFNDVLGGGAQWTLGTKANTYGNAAFTEMPEFLFYSGTALDWWGHAYGTSDNGGEPRFAMTTNAVASSDSSMWNLSGDTMLGITPNELYAHPNRYQTGNACPTVRATVPTDGIYRVRGHIRDLNSGGSGDGVRFTFSADGLVAITSYVSLDGTRHMDSTAEKSIEGDRLWLKAGETFDAVIDPIFNYYCDATGFSVCYEQEDAETPSVVNVDFTGTGSGKFSANATRGREGYSDCLSWNALRPGSAASVAVENCYEADGTTPRNLTVALSRASGAAIAAGSAVTGTAFFDSFVVSSGSEDAYTFTISKLKANEPYTLYLYSANGAASGNAAFTVGGVTKGTDRPWTLGETKMLTRFDVVSDANGEISGTFAAADGNGGAFNGLTLVGELPGYKAPQFTIIVR